MRLAPALMRNERSGVGDRPLQIAHFSLGQPLKAGRWGLMQGIATRIPLSVHLFRGFGDKTINKDNWALLIWAMNFLLGAALRAAPNKKFIAVLSNADFYISILTNRKTRNLPLSSLTPP